MCSARLIDIYPELPEGEPWVNLHINDVVTYSNKVTPGALFIALKGKKNDGAEFIPEAERNGALAVLCSADSILPDTKLPVIRATEPRKALSRIAAGFFAQQPAHMVAVTGTDGKTSTADFYRQFIHLLGKSSAAIGTLGVFSGEGKKLFEGTHTTPDPITLHRELAELTRMNIQHVCMEASSHGLDQYRLHGVRLQAAAFTNIARDHLDYHKTEVVYFAAKARLFSEVLPEGALAVLNQDDKRFAELVEICNMRKQRVLGFGFKGSDFTLHTITPNQHGQIVACNLLGAPHTLTIPLVGAFQVMNILAALGLVIGSGENLEAALACIPRLQGVPGRLEKVAQTPHGATIYVDYAHTPAALANILQTLRPHTLGKLHVVFGCGGDRDAGKRPQMGKAASELADFAYVTDDNPRSENPDAIRRAIMDACAGGQEIADRKKAIYTAVAALKAGDVLVLAGKGHEKVQIIAGVEYPFDDAQMAREAVNAL